MGKSSVTISSKKSLKKSLSNISRKQPSPPPTPVVKQTVQPLDDVVFLDKSTIKLDRQIYSRKGFTQTVGIEFEEFQKKEDTFSVTQFFQLYDALFFDIPRLGVESHNAIKRRSNEFLRGYNAVDPQDLIIDGLNDKVLELEQQILLAGQSDPEHPFFRNGTLVAETLNGSNSGKFFYMDKGYKRKVNYTSDFYKTLLKVLGYGETADYPTASQSILSQIKTGPNLGEGNFEQSTYIEEGELLVGVNVTDDTKSATINKLRTEVKSLNQTIEDLQDQITEITTGPITQGGNGEDLGGSIDGDPDLGGSFGGFFGNNGPI